MFRASADCQKLQNIGPLLKASEPRPTAKSFRAAAHCKKLQSIRPLLHRSITEKSFRALTHCCWLRASADCKKLRASATATTSTRAGLPKYHSRAMEARGMYRLATGLRLSTPPPKALGPYSAIADVEVYPGGMHTPGFHCACP